MDGELLAETFIELTDTMVAGFDLIEFLHVLTDRSVQLLDVDAAGLLLADPRGELRVVAASRDPASRSTPRTWPRKRVAGRGSRPSPGSRDSPLCRPCRCGCVSRSSVR